MHEWFLAQQGATLYGLFVLSLLGGAVGLPIPEDLPLLIMGAAIHQGVASWQPTFFLGYIAIVACDGLIFWAGRTFGPRILQSKLFGARFSPERMATLNLRIDRHAFWMIFLARHLFYFRTATFLSCGALRIRFTRFIIADACAALISVPTLLGLGYLGAEHLPTLLGWIQTMKYLSLPVVVLLIGALYWHVRRRARLHGDCKSPRTNQ